jgi:hypothetical protein
MWSCTNPKDRTTDFPLLELLWISQWHMLGSGVHTYTLLDRSHTQGVQTVLLIQMVFWRKHLPLTVDTSDRLYDDFIRYLFLHVHRETSVLANELGLLEKSDQFGFLHTTCLANLKGSVVWSWRKHRAWGFLYLLIFHLGLIPLTHFILPRRPTPFLTTSLVLFPPRSV